MPTYSYKCQDCDHRFDAFQKFSEDPLTVCPSCEGTIRRVLQPVGVVFKVQAGYINDSRAKTSGSDEPKAKGGSDPKKPKDGSSDSGSPAKSEPAAKTPATAAAD